MRAWRAALPWCRAMRTWTSPIIPTTPSITSSSPDLQATRRPRWVLEQMLRIGQRVIVSFPNFGHWRSRFDLLLHGRMPVTENMPLAWYETPNIHFCTIRDFVELAEVMGAKMERAVALDSYGHRVRFNLPGGCGT